MSDDLEQLGERIAEHSAHLDAAMHRLLTDLREFDKRGGWSVQGARSFAHWLSWRVGWGLVMARDRVRIAGKLGALPLIDDALRRGELSYSKLRAMTRVATPANEPLLLEYARHMTASQLENTCRKLARVQRNGEEPKPRDDQQRRYVRRRDTEDGMVKIEAVLHPEEAELVWTMLNHAAAELTRAPQPACSDSAEARAAAPAPVAAAAPSSRTMGHELHDSAKARTAAPAPGAAAAPSSRTIGREFRDSAEAGANGSAQGGAGAVYSQDATGQGIEDSAGSCAGGLGPVAMLWRHFREVAVRDSAEARAGAGGEGDRDSQQSWGNGEWSDDVSGSALGAVSEQIDSLADECVAGWPTVGGRVEEGVDAGDCRDRDSAESDAVVRGAGAGREASGSVVRRHVDEVRRAFSRADGLVAIAQGYLRGDRPERSPVEIVVTIPASSLREGAGDPVDVAEMGESLISGAAARRLSCDGGLVEVTEDEHGAPLSVGRKRRTITGALKRALRARDTMCTFPGCTNRLFLEGHHIKHWVDGGETSLGNTALLCSFHHRHVHEYGYSIELGADRRPRFRDPRGRLVPVVPRRPVVAELGWPRIRAMNEPLGIDASTNACKWNGRPVDYHPIIGYLVAAEDGGQVAGGATSEA